MKYARSKVDFVFGIGLYMVPSDMELRIGTIQDYNNEIVIATPTQSLGVNKNINTKPTPPPVTVSDGTSTIKQGISDLAPTVLPIPISNEHEDNKTALIVGGITIGLILIHFLTHSTAAT